MAYPRVASFKTQAEFARYLGELELDLPCEESVESGPESLLAQSIRLTFEYEVMHLPEASLRPRRQCGFVRQHGAGMEIQWERFERYPELAAILGNEPFQRFACLGAERACEIGKQRKI